MNVQEKYSEWLEKATAAAHKKYGQGVDLDKVKAAVDNLLDIFSEDEDRAREANEKVCDYISYTVNKSSHLSYPVEKLAIEAIVGKKFSGNFYARAKALFLQSKEQTNRASAVYFLLKAGCASRFFSRRLFNSLQKRGI